MYREMADKTFRDDQWSRRFEPHVAPLNEQILTLTRGEHAPPLIPPMHGGVAARIVEVFRDPGPKAGGPRGSGFLSWQNDDRSAERHAGLAKCAGLLPQDVVSLNSYLWYINREPTSDELRDGLGAFLSLYALIMEPSVVIFHGGTAHTFLRLLERAAPDWSESSGARPVILETYHTSAQALHHADAAVRQARNTHLFNSLCVAAGAIGRASAPRCTCPASRTI